MSLKTLIKKQIKKNGPMTLAEYMALCLSHPEYGYYMRRDPLGAQGDFTTSPEISQIFGELVGLWLARQWEAMGKPECALVELGPGRGTLMNDMLRATKKAAEFHDAISVHMVEISPALKQKQWGLLANKHPRIHWHESIEELPQKPWLVIANEFFDALPVRQFVWVENAWHERLIDIADDRLRFVITREQSDRSNPALDCFVGQGPPRNDAIQETCQSALDIVIAITQHIAKEGGAALIVDYGYTEGKGDTLQAMKNHAYHEVLSDPGEADLTAHVDFTALSKAAKKAGANVFGPIPQGKFLMSIGAGQRVQKLCAQANAEQSANLISGLERLASPDAMGDLFKVLAIVGANHPKPEGF